ncbi:MAG: large-conductance mechanosensitive channel protein MscL [Flavobacteriaceae bacterium]|jgi:large conductance mechanosensitive channel|nr:large-conductance mechanosensitive channel protein MscL [Flavobacteriaceae bacterium]HTO36410.1 large-conductance mechanosensitive channel protein MscL [Flavobacterium sp.]
MGMIKEFKEFAMRGNLVDMGVAFVMGGAFGKIVTAFVDGMVMPLVGLLTAGKDFSKLVWEIKAGTKEIIDEAGVVTTEGAEPIVVKYGEFITVAIDFIIVAFVMFMIIKGINKMKKAEPEPEPAGPTQEELLSEIRDLLKK